jgi:hypothetical protein
MIYKLLLYQFLSERDCNYNPILHVYQPMEEEIRLSIIYLIKRELNHQAQAQALKRDATLSRSRLTHPILPAKAGFLRVSKYSLPSCILYGRRDGHGLNHVTR